MDALRSDKHYTWADYVTWDQDIRCELIDGIAHMMTAPSMTHQSISMNLSTQLNIFLKGKPCKVFAAPFDVRLNAEDGDDTIVQPDILVVCDKSKLSEKGCQGAPDLVVEILSPSSGAYDKILKFNKYLKAGVQEYWIVYPDRGIVDVFVWDNGKYVASSYSEEDTMPSHVLEGCMITLADVFAK
ncbi:MAG: Uma2 family endonuclease [Peptococcaceae bacterium]|nr:Uma2 family endonuclease [Peptococcaceae bacterium]